MSHNTTAFLESQVSLTRTVFDILWSCLFTIFACTWTAQHLNVPLQRDECGIKPGWKGDLKYGLRNFWTSAKWMIITILAPELLITINSGQLANAHKTAEMLKEFAKEDGVPWSLTHSLFANIGGFVAREFEPERAHASRSQDGKEEIETKDPAISKDSVKAVSLGGQTALTSRCVDIPTQVGRSASNEHVTPTEESSPSEGMEVTSQVSNLSGANATNQELEAQPQKEPRSRFILADDFLYLRRNGIIKLPYITRDEIMDKGKNDNFARVLAVCQTLWLVVQMIVRAIRHLEVSQLEVGTAAFVSCAITIYALNLHKPKAVGVPWTVQSFSGPMPTEMSDRLEGIRNLWVGISGGSRSSVPNHYSYETDKDLLGFIFSSVLFGAIHFAALGSTFPSHVERISWCAASALCTGVCVCVLLLIVGFITLGREALLQTVVSFLVVPLYILARIYLIVELFRCLFFLPPSAFVGTWASSIPHVS